ncbi:hypothetical protein Trydic_g19120 [Trypoxylus dichotomus]
MCVLTLARLTSDSLNCLLQRLHAPPGKVPGRGVPKAKGRSGVLVFAFHFRFRRPTQAPGFTLNSPDRRRRHPPWRRCRPASSTMTATKPAGEFRAPTEKHAPLPPPPRYGTADDYGRAPRYTFQNAIQILKPSKCLIKMHSADINRNFC